MVSTVGPSTVSYATRMPFQRLTFYHNGRYWVFYGSGTNFVYRTSIDAAAWSAPTTIHAGDLAAWSSACFDGTYVHYACSTYTAAQPIYYRRGTPDVGGGITWSAAEQTAVAGSGDRYGDPTIAIDSNGYPFISYLREKDCYCAKASTNNGTWTLDWDVLIKAIGVTDVFSSVVPLTSTRMYIVYGERNEKLYGKIWNGAAWSGEETLSTSKLETSLKGAFCVTSIGDDVHVTFLTMNPDWDIIYRKRTYGSGWEAEETVYDGDVSTYKSSPVISHDGSTIYVLWMGSPTADHIFYRARNGAWDARVDWLDESAQGLTSNELLSCYFESFGGHLGAIWVSTPASPYNVRHDELPLPAGGIEVKGTNMGHKLLAAGAI